MHHIVPTLVDGCFSKRNFEASAGEMKHQPELNAHRVQYARLAFALHVQEQKSASRTQIACDVCCGLLKEGARMHHTIRSKSR